MITLLAMSHLSFTVASSRSMVSRVSRVSPKREHAGPDVEPDGCLGDRTVGGELEIRPTEERHVGLEQARAVRQPGEDVGKRELGEDARHHPAAGRRVDGPLERRRPAARKSGRGEIRREVAGARIDGDGDIGARKAPALEKRRVPDVDLATDEGEAEEAAIDRGLQRALEAGVDDPQGGKEIREPSVGDRFVDVGERLRFLALGRVHSRRIAEIDLSGLAANERQFRAAQFDVAHS